MALDEMKYHLSEMDNHIRAYVDDSLEYAELKGFRYSMVLITSIFKMLVLSVLILLTLLVLSIYTALYLSEIMGNTYDGFIVIGGIYALLGILFYLFRNRVNKPIMRIFSSQYFKS